MKLAKYVYRNGSCYEGEIHKLKSRLAKLEAVREAASDLHWAYCSGMGLIDFLIKLGQTLAAAEE